MTEQRHIHLVDDDEAVRHSASFMLRHAGFRVTTHKDGVAFLDALEGVEAGCVLLDVQMPVLDGLAVQEKLNDRGFDMPVIVLTGHGDVSVAVQAMKAGAVDFVEKPYEKDALIKAIRNAFERVDARGAREQLSAEAEAKLAKLSPRERDILNGLVAGMTNKMIGDVHGISPRTVEIHRSNLMEKLGVDNLSSALRIAFAAGLGLDASPADTE